MTRSTLIAPAIAVLASTPSVMREMLAPLPDELRAAPGDAGWSARDVVAHLQLRQRPAIVGRIEAILADPGGAIPDVPPDDIRSAALPFDELIRAFADGRAECVELLRRLTAEQLLLSGVHSEVGDISIADVVHHVAYHDLVHIAQAAQLAAAPLEPLRGALRAFR